MQSDLVILGFRALKKLEISALGRVNLITGKNNSGKSSVLEALRLYLGAGSPGVMLDLLRLRDEGPTGQDAASVLNLFHGRPVHSDIDDGLKIEIRLGPAPFGHFIMEMVWWDASAKSVEANFVEGYAPAVRVGKRLVVLDRPLVRDPVESPGLVKSEYISSNGLSEGDIERLWGKVDLTDLEEKVEAAIRIVSPEVERVSLVPAEREGLRRPFVRVRGARRPIALRSLGEGVHRLFGIALAMVNARDGYLLVDEVENGVHYSIQPELWSFIFQLSALLNVHVFATTHSWDSITAFQHAAEQSRSDGRLIRLAWRNGAVQAVEYSDQELAVATRQTIEVR